MTKQFLIELWMANGFISSTEMLEVEDLGDEVWNELYWRSFFQDIKTDEFGKITSFKMHDLVHDLAQSVAEEFCCITYDNGLTSMSERTRHVSIYAHTSFEKPDSTQLHQVISLKTCIFPEHIYGGHLLPHLLECCSLRVLGICRLGEKLSSSIGNLKHLRYLNLSGGRFKTLPKSLCSLWNLQILKLDYWSKLKKLPNCFKRLKALQHLSLRRCRSLSSLAPKMGELTCLRSLNVYLVDKKKGFLLAELGSLKLKGKLHIKHLERVRSVMDAKDANLSSKYLSGLLLSWDRNEESQSQKKAEQILEVLQPHTQQLQTLGVKGYTGAYFPQWISSPSLKYLHSAKFLDCKNCLNLPRLAKLPSLKRLEISNMNNVKYLDHESCDNEVAGSFMALEFLFLAKLPSLIRLSREDAENMFPRLSTLYIFECPKLALPCLPSLKELSIKGKCNQDLLSSIRKFLILESMGFSSIEELTCFPDGMLQELTSLKMLDIIDLSRLEVLTTEIINLNVIEQLHIRDCHSLEPFPEQLLQGLHSLKKLTICGSHKFKLSAGFQHLTSLEDLNIESCPEVEGFPEALQHMTALQSLTLVLLPNLGSLPDWLGNLAFLHSIYIFNCPKLLCLPISIQCLSSLKSLRIYGCPELRKRCDPETGEDWPKISHVQDRFIDNEFIFNPGRCGPLKFFKC